MSISARQSRAAIGHLGLEQKDVYEAIGVSRQYLHKFHRDDQGMDEDAKLRIRMSLKNYYEKQGIEFLEHDGLRRKPSGVIRTLQGYDGFKEFIYDVYNTVRSHGGNICVTNVDERQFERWQGSNASDYLSKMAGVDQLTFRILVREGDDYYTASGYAEYRELPVEYFSGVPTYIYGDKKAEILFGDDDVTIFLSENKQLADAERKQFDMLWESAIA